MLAGICRCSSAAVKALVIESVCLGAAGRPHACRHGSAGGTTEKDEQRLVRWSSTNTISRSLRTLFQDPGEQIPNQEKHSNSQFHLLRPRSRGRRSRMMADISLILAGKCAFRSPACVGAFAWCCCSRGDTCGLKLRRRQRQHRPHRPHRPRPQPQPQHQHRPQRSLHLLHHREQSRIPARTFRFPTTPF